MKISVLGIGIMGAAVAERLLDTGHEVVVYNRTKTKAVKLEKKGAALAQSPVSALEQAKCVLLFLADAQAIKEVLLTQGPETLAGKTIIQMGTIGPSESIEIQKAVFERGGEYFECPVLGSKQEASEGKLILMVGSTPEKFDEWKEFLKLLGPQPRHIGEVGKAAALKLAINQLIASYACCYAFSLGLIEKEGISAQDFLEIIRPSALYSPMLDKKLPKWLNRDYSNPNFSVKHLLKDVDLVLREAHSLKMSTQVVKAIRHQLASAVNCGLGDLDYSAVLEVIHNDPLTKHP